jgi:hypothetical protein
MSVRASETDSIDLGEAPKAIPPDECIGLRHGPSRRLWGFVRTYLHARVRAWTRSARASIAYVCTQVSLLLHHKMVVLPVMTVWAGAAMDE